MADTPDNDPNLITQPFMEPDVGEIISAAEAFLNCDYSPFWKTKVLQNRGDLLSVLSPIELSKPQSTSSYCTSIPPEIRNGRIENGRVYATYGRNEYGLPIDDYELGRIDMNHEKYSLLQNNKLFLAPLPPSPQKMLDIGTGTGIFAIDLADMFPSAIVIGTDISPMQPTWVLPNCQFEIDDAEADWVYPENSFDHIHGRDLYHSIRDWPRLIGQAYSHLGVGGYLGLACVWPIPESDDDTLPREGSAYVEVCNAFQEIADKIGAAPDAPWSYKSWMIEAGFQDVREHIFKIPTSMASGPEVKKDRRLGVGQCDGRRRGILASRFYSESGQNERRLGGFIVEDEEGVGKSTVS